MSKKMRYFYDTEFKEDGKTIDLISIGIVAEDGREFYAVSTEFDTRRVANDPWLMENVMPSIGHETYAEVLFEGMPLRQNLTVTDPFAMSRSEIKNAILDFTAGTYPEFWNWYGAYDHVALCQLFGKMIDLPKNFPMLSMDLKQLHKELKSPGLPEQPKGKHNALDDARHNVVRFHTMRELMKNRDENASLGE